MTEAEMRVLDVLARSGPRSTRELWVTPSGLEIGRQLPFVLAGLRDRGLVARDGDRWRRVDHQLPLPLGGAGDAA